MKLYTNIPLNWPIILHLYSISRIYPCNFYNFSIYNVMKTNPIKLHSYAPINKLCRNHKYYCYDIYNKRYYDLEMSSNIIYDIKYNTNIVNNVYDVNNKNNTKHTIYIPKHIQQYDILTVYDETSLTPYRAPSGTFLV